MRPNVNIGEYPVGPFSMSSFQLNPLIPRACALYKVSKTPTITFRLDTTPLTRVLHTWHPALFAHTSKRHRSSSAMRTTRESHNATHTSVQISQNTCGYSPKSCAGDQKQVHSGHGSACGSASAIHSATTRFLCHQKRVAPSASPSSQAPLCV